MGLRKLLTVACVILCFAVVPTADLKGKKKSFENIAREAVKVGNNLLFKKKENTEPVITGYDRFKFFVFVFGVFLGNLL